MSKFAFQRAFQELTEAEIATLMARAERYTWPAGARVLREGEQNQRIFIILEGTIRVVRYAREGKEKVLAPLAPGDCFGEMSFIDGLGASATLLANTDIVAQGIDQRLLDAMLPDHPGLMERIYLSLLHTVIHRLRAVDAALLMEK
jgi:CRP-like cAMP-binding protein